MEVSISTGLYYTKPYREILDIIQKSGCSSIELFLNQSFIDVPIEELENELDKRGLKVASIHLPLTFIAYERGESEAEWIEKGLEYSKRLGAKVIVSHFFYADNDKNKANDKSHLENIVKYSDHEGVFVCTENLPNLWVDTVHQRPDELKRFLAEHSAHMTFDTTHVATHERDLLDDYKMFKEHIRNIHLSDFGNGAEHKLLGDGTLPIKELIQTLRNDGYKYPVTLEYDFENLERNDIRNDEEAVEALIKSIDYIKNCC